LLPFDLRGLKDVSEFWDWEDRTKPCHSGEGFIVVCAAAFRFATRHCKKRAAMVTVARRPHRSPPASRVMNCTSRRSSGVLVIIPINVRRPVPNRIRAHAVSIEPMRGCTTDRRAAGSASKLLPKNHQKKMPTNGQLRALQVSGIIPFGTHSRLAGLTRMYGNCATSTGKFSANGAFVRMSATLVATSSVRCNSGVIEGTTSHLGSRTTTLSFGVGREYESIDSTTPRIKLPRTGHKSARQTTS